MSSNSPADSAREDLAYLRGLIDGGDGVQAPFGEAYFAAGVVYALQMAGHAVQALGWLPDEGPINLAIGLVPTLVFLAVLAWIIWRNRHVQSSGVVSRTIGILFGSLGLANLVLLLVIGSISLREDSTTIWLIYPCAVFVLQGAAWFVAYALRRKAWLMLVCLAWNVSAIAMALNYDRPAGMIIATTFGLVVGMVLPGWVMMRRQAPSAI